MAEKCKACGHLKGGGPHECPGPAYAAARDRILRDAARAAELFAQDELEAFTREAFGGEAEGD